MKNKNNTI